MAAPTVMSSIVSVESSIEEHSYERELGLDAVFMINSAKPGNGVEQLRDNNLETYWQSDGTFPHQINIQFPQKVAITKVCMYVNYSVDESYTPRKLALAVGSCPHDLVDVVATELQEPSGWVVFTLSDEHTSKDSSVRGHFLQIKILSMHQNGKDTHVRQVKVFGSRLSQKVMADLNHDDFKTVEMAQFCVLR